MVNYSYGTVLNPHDAVDLYERTPQQPVAWGAVMAGAVTALALQVLLAMLGTGIGIVDPIHIQRSPHTVNVDMGVVMWWSLSSLLSLTGGGWMAGRLSGMARSVDGGLHGMLAWAVTVLVTVLLTSITANPLTNLVRGVLTPASTSAVTPFAAVASTKSDGSGLSGGDDLINKSGASFENVKREALALLSQTSKPELQFNTVLRTSTELELSGLVERLLIGGRDSVFQTDRDAVISKVMARAGINRDDAAKRVEGWEKAVEQERSQAAELTEQARQKALTAASNLADAVSRAMLLGFMALALGSFAAWWSGAWGQRHAIRV